MTLQPSIFAGTTGCCLQVIFCFICVPAHLHLHISVVLDLELDLWCLHAVNMLQYFIFAVSTDHLQPRMSLFHWEKLLMHLDLFRCGICFKSYVSYS